MAKFNTNINPFLHEYSCLAPLAMNNYTKLEDLTVLKRSLVLLNNVEIGQDKLQPGACLRKNSKYAGGGHPHPIR